MNWDLHIGNCLTVLPTLPDKSVDCVVTSPPYYGLRDYQTGKWMGGDPDCPHVRLKRCDRSTIEGSHYQSREVYREKCSKCGAVRVDEQIGLESTPQEFVCKLVEVFRGIRRVLRDKGSIWIVIGDSYAGSGNYRGAGGESTLSELQRRNRGARGESEALTPRRLPGLKPKDLIGIPWMLAFALRDDGWYLRSECIWHKPNTMPASVRDRPTVEHEHVFLFTKSRHYHYDYEAVMEEVRSGASDIKKMLGKKERIGGKSLLNDPGERTAANPRSNLGRKRAVGGTRVHGNVPGRDDDGRACNDPDQLFRNLRTVWSVATTVYHEGHFAVFPPKLITPCILASCPPAGRRCDCDEVIHTPVGSGECDDPSLLVGRAGYSRPRREGEGTRPITRREQRSYAAQMKASSHRAKMEKACGAAFAHYIRTDRAGARPIPPALLARFRRHGWLTDPAPCGHEEQPAGTVLDPFAGSGTVMQVANYLGRHAIGIELNPAYEPLIRKRMAQQFIDFADGTCA